MVRSMPAAAPAPHADSGRPSALAALRRAPATWPWLLDSLGAFLLSQVIFYGAAALALALVPEYHGTAYDTWHTGAPTLIDASWRWDAGWYASVILHGYQIGPGQSNVPFFPLYPLLVRLVLLPIGTRGLFWAGVLVNHVVFLLALIAVWLYAEGVAGRAVARRTIYLLAIFPASLFFSAAYSEAVFLLFAAAFFLALQRGRYLLAGWSGLFAALARPPGILLGVVFAFELWRHRTVTRREMLHRLAALLLLPLGLLALSGYFWWRFDNPIAFVTAQNAWEHRPDWPWESLALALRQVAGGVHSSTYAVTTINTAATVLALALGLALLRRDPGAAAFVLVSLAVPLSLPTIDNPAMNMARYVVVLLPIFVELARRLRTRWSLALVITCFLPAQLLMTVLFVRWYWIT